MSNYTVATNFGAKDSLASGNPSKLILGAQLTTEFNNIATAIASKLDSTGSFVSSITGTANQVAASASTGAVTLSLPQNLIVPTPASGTALTVVAASAATNTQFDTSAAGGVCQLVLARLATAKALIGVVGTAAQIINGSSVDDFALRTNGTNFLVSTNSGTSAQFVIDGSGNVNVPNGTGTLSPVYAGIPQNSQAGSYTLVLGDANKHIVSTNSGAATFTIPANGSVAYPIGTAVTFVNRGATNLSIAITTDTLILANSSSTGTRTLTNLNGIATALKISATQWIISGSGLT